MFTIEDGDVLMLIPQLIYTTMRIIYKAMTKCSNKVCDNLFFLKTHVPLKIPLQKVDKCKNDAQKGSS